MKIPINFNALNYDFLILEHSDFDTVTSLFLIQSHYPNPHLQTSENKMGVIEELEDNDAGCCPPVKKAAQKEKSWDHPKFTNLKVKFRIEIESNFLLGEYPLTKIRGSS